MAGGGGGGGGRPRAVFMAFGTRGDVFPVAALATAFARDQQQYAVVFITHSAHRSLSAHLAASNVRYMPVSSPPVLAAEQVENISGGSQSNHEDESFSSRKMIIQMEHRKECLSSVEAVFGDDPSINGDFVVINFFALEGWHLAELFQVKCIIAAPYFVPYSAPSSFQRQFKHNFPLLYKYFQEAPANTVCWTDIIHWMWALFTESWGSWRSNCLNLSPIPFTDPVTNLPLWHVREESPLLLYGFSKEIVECPGYWPSSAHACGFWFLPTAWQFSCDKCMELSRNMNSSLGSVLCAKHSSMERFLVGNSYSSRPVFVGLSSIVTESSEAAASSLSDDSALLFNGRLFCFSGWLFPRCAAAIHHAGSGSTAAALLAGTPQVVCPSLLDQFYWAERLHWLGVAPEPLQRQHLIPDSDDASSIHNAAEVLHGAIKSALLPEIKAQATRISDRLSFEDGIGEALRILKERVLIQDQT
ncbi:sterol 3-beta-glucosyltransferase UGT80B1 isoform X4 [Panicum hallii]|uniref:sterol 3-beta-glucosyltransferase UGT80B1 isoform X4 n=1 Tax=Panicum hallii TaxID=206008 RepID=UPI000DF4E239|nr:sterol 3-beta-glucosyltransferase UGT80B1 isoform X4 [Panicum hallii]